MKKFLVMALLSTIAVFLLSSCDEESEDPPEFTNGLMVKLSQNPANSGGIESVKSFTARSYVQCLYEYGNTYTFTAQTSSGDEWKVKFKWDGTDSDSIVYISDDYSNEIKMTSAEYGNYYISKSSANSDQTFLKILRLDPENTVEAEFEGFIYESGSSADPDTLKDGYLITSKFVSPK